MEYRALSCFLPVYNEAEEIERVVLSARAVLEKLFEDYEIIIVNDGSTDNTLEISKKLADDNPHIKIVNSPVRLGYAQALKTGFAAAKKELIFYTDADNQFNFQDLPKLLPLINYASIASGFRIRRSDSFYRKFLSRLYNLIIRFSFGLKVKDVNASFKLYRREIFERIKITSRSFLIDAEILIKANKLGYVIKQVGVTHYPRKSGLSCFGLRQGWRTLWEIISLWKQTR